MENSNDKYKSEIVTDEWFNNAPLDENNKPILMYIKLQEILKKHGFSKVSLETNFNGDILSIGNLEL